MAGGILIGSAGDLITSTLGKLSKTFTDTMRDPDYPLSRIFLQDAKETVDGGIRYEKRVRARVASVARFVNLFEATSAQINDLMVTMQTPWAHFERKMAFDEREPDMNNGAARIVELLKGRRSDAYESLFNLTEDALSGVPKNAADVKTLFGALYWLPTLAVGVTDPVGGFGATTLIYGDASTGTTLGGVDRSVAANSRCKSWAATYSGSVDDVLIKLIRRALTRTNFMTLAQLEGDKPAGMTDFVMAGHTVCDELEDRINKGPDDLNGDEMRMTKPKLRGVPVVRVPAYEALSYAPIQGVKKSKFKTLTLKGRWMKEKPAKNSQDNQNVWVVQIDSSALVTCEDPRSAGWTIAKVR